MADSRRGLHGGKRNNCGRKRKYEGRNAQKNWDREHRRIFVSLTIFNSWKDAKSIAGYELRSDSEFAAHLLSLEYRRRSDETRGYIQPAECPEPSSNIININTIGQNVISTPIKKTMKDVLYKLPAICESPILAGKHEGTEENDEVENTQRFQEVEMATHDECIGYSPIHESFVSVGGNTSLFTDDEGDASEENSDENNRQHDISYSALQYLNADRDLESDDSETSSLEDIDSIINNSTAYCEDESEDSLEEDMHIDYEDEHDYNGGDLSSDDEVLSSLEQQTSQNFHNMVTTEVAYGPHKKLSRGDEICMLKQEYKTVTERKFICSLDLLLEVFQSRCQIPGCVQSPTVNHHFNGTTLIVSCSCSSGHKYRFTSSHNINGIYANNIQAAASLLCSGNSFAKIQRLSKFFGLAFLSKSTYYRLQRVYLIPTINEWWCWMRKQLLHELSGEDVVVGGDGQCDSPGYNAKNLCYFMADLKTNYIIDIQILDKRHVKLVSNNMEREAAQRGLESLCQDIKVVEFVTDASSSVKILLETQFKDIVHGLDVWHKAKSIKKCLTKIGKPKAMQKIRDWSAHIVRHFWYCSSSCGGNETSHEEALRAMKDKWIALLHHVCNEHDWIGGSCDHEDGEHDTSLPWFDNRDADFIELQKVILNPDLLASFKYYTQFRHTGSIECANSLSLVYTPKRMPFSYRAFKARKQLTAIDWNFHINLPQAKNKSTGDVMVTRKYNPRTRKWDVKVVKVEKGYDYIPLLIAKVFRSREDDNDSVTRSVPLNESDPGLIAQTIAHIVPPPTKEIPKRSRFEQKK
ncbi:uncharacterized protein LOC114526045 isoform X2 [Dendronephthya gigantea]|uniref:uncharacterized protein LOC114526045 isoform X2 n=1 Tax=Dendronephthya gigantea TaxID=151771 RepID=UPI00106D1DFF|nr:uncharacterized protein LOC114526045 isoform X2 [Dendronephthya gigantea]